MTRIVWMIFGVAVLLLLGGTAGGVLLVGCGAQRPIAPEHELEHTYAVRDPQFQRVLSELLGPRLVHGNRIETLSNGDEFYPAQLEAIHSATQSITIETFMYWKSDVGAQFADALCERAKAGVPVHLTIDSIGSDQIDEAYIQQMEEAGVAIVHYNPIQRIVLIFAVGNVTQRTHRKIVVIDGRVGFIGGAGIAEMWCGDARNKDEWRDTFYRVEGPVVAQLQSAFVDNWLHSTGELLDSEAYFPSIEPAGSAQAQVFCSSAEGGSSSMELMYLVAINAATETIDIGTPYFVPNGPLQKTLLAALDRGVRVRLIVPGPHTDNEITKHASRTSWQALLEAGLELYEYQPTFYHQKVMIVDGLMTVVGSANLDPLSFRVNDEANLNVLDEAFARSLTVIFEQDLAVSNRVTELEHENRSWGDRLLEFLWLPFKPFM